MKRSFLACVLCAAACAPAPPRPVPGPGLRAIAGPFEHQTLAVYILEDPAAEEGEDFLLLADGLANGTILLTEQSPAQVRSLWIENRSDRPLFILGGEVVKGGKQDRVIARDYVIPPRSGRVALSTMCVERGRWSSSTQGEHSFFTGSSGTICGKPYAAVRRGGQGEVWREVREWKKKIVTANGLPPSKSDSVNEEMTRQETDDSVTKFQSSLGDLLKDRPTALGVLFVLNGRLSAAHLFGGTRLFRALYPRLLKSAIWEALTEPGSGRPPLSPDLLERILEASARGTRETVITEVGTYRTVEGMSFQRSELLWNGVLIYTNVLAR